MFLPDPAGAGPIHSAVERGCALLDPLELRAAVLAQADAGRFGWDASASPSRVRRRLRAVLAWLTGIKGVTPLADERLEKLRLFACMVRRGDRRMPAVGDDLLALGFRPQALRQAMAVALA